MEISIHDLRSVHTSGPWILQLMGAYHNWRRDWFKVLAKSCGYGAPPYQK
ncbi:MAG: hypothetical protein IPO25_13010 [Saprospiraceae bacterium]|nr:hypothetical protein [Saprospiraceae bacterium]